MKATDCTKYIPVIDKTLDKLSFLLQQDCLAFLFLGKTTNYIIKVYLFCNVRLNTEPSQVCLAIMNHGGPEITFDELKFAEASFC